MFKKVINRMYNIIVYWAVTMRNKAPKYLQHVVPSLSMAELHSELQHLDMFDTLTIYLTSYLPKNSHFCAIPTQIFSGATVCTRERAKEARIKNESFACVLVRRASRVIV